MRQPFSDPDEEARYQAFHAELLKPIEPEYYDSVAYIEDLRARRDAISAEGERNAIKAALKKQAIIRSRKGF